jgi:hypothetical protein
MRAMAGYGRAVLLALLGLLAFAGGTGDAHATPSLDACTGVLQRTPGTATPVVVTESGIWCLDQDMVEGADFVGSFFTMILVSADDVTIDCRGHRVEYSGSADLIDGIATGGGWQRLTVRNCHLFGFGRAILTGNGDGFLVEDNSVHDSRPDYTGNSTSIRGYGSGMIRRNRIYDAVCRAISANGSSQVLDNLVDGVKLAACSYATGIDMYVPDGAEVRGNTVRGLDPLPEFSQHKAVVVGAGGTGSRRSLVADNVLVHDGSMGDIGVFCSSGNNVLVSDNVLSGFFAPTAGCTALVDNDISP